MQKQHAVVVRDYESIRQGLYLLLNTTVGELVADPAFGCGVRNRIFKANDTFNRTMIKEDIYFAIQKFAPYIRVRREEIAVKSQTLGKVSVTVKGTSLLDFTVNLFEIDILRTV